MQTVTGSILTSGNIFSWKRNHFYDHSLPNADSSRAVVSYLRKYGHLTAQEAVTRHDHSCWLGLQPRLQCPPNSWAKDLCNSDPLSSAVGLDTGLPMLNYSGAPNNPAKANTQTQALRLMPYASFVWPFLQNQRMSYAICCDHGCPKSVCVCVGGGGGGAVSLKLFKKRHL